jgi:hypothetical protein
MNKTTKILEIGGSAYALAPTVTDAEVLQLLGILSKGLRRQDTRYLPTATERYGPEVLVIDAEIVAVKLGISGGQTMERADYDAARRAYDAAHPEEKGKAAA